VPKTTVSLPLDADVLAYLQGPAMPADWQAHINGVLRFYMDTSLTQQPDFEVEDEWEQAARIGQMTPARPGLR
jgi:hypothetical protein